MRRGWTVVAEGRRETDESGVENAVEPVPYQCRRKPQSQKHDRRNEHEVVRAGKSVGCEGGLDELAPGWQVRVAHPQEGERGLEEDVTGYEDDDLRDEHRHCPGQEVMPHDSPVPGTVGERRLYVGGVLHGEEDRSIVPQPDPESAEQHRDAEDDPEALGVEREDHEAHRQEGQNHIHLRHTLDDPIHPSSEPCADGREKPEAERDDDAHEEDQDVRGSEEQERARQTVSDIRLYLPCVSAAHGNPWQL